MIELPIDAEIAEMAGVTTGIATPDALIAATALVHRIPLMTRNRRHFELGPGYRSSHPPDALPSRTAIRSRFWSKT
jgi:predicted nucleic acid-binding protein